MPTGTQAAPDNFSKAITAIVRLKMQWLKQTQSGIERITGIPHGTFSRIINDQRLPDITQLRRIAAAVELPLPALMKYAESVAAGAEPPFEEIYRSRSLRWECPVDGCNHARTMYLSGGDIFDEEDHAEQVERIRLQHPNHPPSALTSVLHDSQGKDDRSIDHAMKDDAYDIDSPQYWGGVD